MNLFRHGPARFYRGFPTRSIHSRFPLPRKRVLGAIAHINSGKTTTSEAMLFAAGALRRMGNVDSGDTTMDYLPTERERGITINSAAIAFSWRDYGLFLVDSPGHLDFTFEVERALRVMDSAIVLLDAVAGVQPQTETVWRQADANALPRLIFVNKMDREGADLSNTLKTIQEYFSATPIVLQYPVFNETGVFLGVHDLLSHFPDPSPSRPYPTSSDSFELDVLTPKQKRNASKAAEKLVETVADHDDEVMAMWIDNESISKVKLEAAIRTACLNLTVVPVLCGASLRGLGVEPLLDAVLKYLPAPHERGDIRARTTTGEDVTFPIDENAFFVAYAFKITHDRHRGRMVHLRALAGQLEKTKAKLLNTTSGKSEAPNKILRILADEFEEIDHVSTGDIFAAVGLKNTKTGDTLVLHGTPNSAKVILEGVRAPPSVFSIALEVDSSTQEKALEEELNRIMDEDSSLELKQDEDTGETLLSGMGELHLEVAIDNLERKLSFPIHRSKPRVSYRESPTLPVKYNETIDNVIGTSHLQGSLHFVIEPLASVDMGNEVIIDDKLFKNEERDAIRSGIHAALGRGPLTGSNVTGAQVFVKRGNDDSEGDIAGLRACAGHGVKNALKLAAVALLEPVMHIEASVPDPYVGEVVTELTHPTRRRGVVENVEADVRFSERKTGKYTNVSAVVPLDGMIGWSTKMRSITKGRGDFQMRFKEYRQVDPGTQQQLITLSTS